MVVRLDVGAERRPVDTIELPPEASGDLLLEENDPDLRARPAPDIVPLPALRPENLPEDGGLRRPPEFGGLLRSLDGMPITLVTGLLRPEGIGLRRPERREAPRIGGI
eukprot:1318214-Amorphochlora_amoeboformis.AAC.2